MMGRIITGRSEKTRKETAERILLLFLLAVMTELFLFHFRTFQSMLYEEIPYPLDRMNTEGMETGGDYSYLLQEEGVNRIFLPELDSLLDGAKLRNVHLDLVMPEAQDDLSRESGICRLQRYIRDESHDRYCGLGEHIYREEISDSHYMWIKGSGTVKTLVLDVQLSEGQVLQVKDITINARVPMQFSFVRCSVLFLLFGLIAVLRKRNCLWQISLFPWNWKKALVTGGIGALLLLPAGYLILQNEYILADRHFQPYQNLAEAFEAGQCHLIEEPPELLIQMENPYDDTARSALGLVDGRDYLWDTVYYKGHYYVYFGVVPCLLFYWPVYHLSGVHLHDALTIFLSALMTYFGIVFCVREWCRRYVKEISFGHYLLMTVSISLGSLITDYLASPDAHDVPRIVGLAFIIWGLFFWLKGAVMEENAGGLSVRYRYIMAGSFCMALAVGCRPNQGIYSFLALPMFWKQIRGSFTRSKKSGILEMLAVLAPYVPVALGLMWYNAVRFGSVFDFGMTYNLTVMDYTKRNVFSDRIITGLYEFLLRIPRYDYAFPFLKSDIFARQNPFGHGSFYYTFFCGGLLCTAPFLWFVPAWGLAGGKLKKESGLIRCGLWLLGLSTINMLFNLSMAGVAYHYMMDFSAMMLAAGWCFALEQRNGLLQGTAAKEWLDLFLKVSLLVMLWYHMNYYFVSTLNLGNTELFYRIYYAFHFW